MLELKKVTKIYETESIKQKALDNVSLSFRKCEFASILGPSGSGKTTLLNIIGGLDKYTSGDLIINGISTKKYKDSNWDSYRNHRIGFVFQSYNLIPHQSVLQNVMLALTLSGVSKSESREKAIKVLNDVGLKEHIYKRPNQLSGGQMQRVAIARALVNDPDILLADEPTGALDSETSVQIMNLLKKIANNKLVIMVTHNPDLAKEYSNRIITLKDGKITSDTNPYKESKQEQDFINKQKKTTMSFLTALSLSFNNLMTKKGRTILVSLAGSIGIIGIALILSLSTGFQAYIDKIQEDTLSSYPLTIFDENADMTQMLLSMMGSRESEDMDDNKVYERDFVTSMFGNVSKNDLKNFKIHLEQNYSKVENDISSIKYSYSISPYVYSKNNDKIVRLNPSTMFSSFSSNTIYSQYSNIYNEMIDDIDTLDEQFEVLAGSWPKEYNELLIVLSEKHTIADMLVYYLGLRDPQELNEMISKMMAGETVEIKNTPYEFTYDELLNIDLRLILGSDLYKYNSKYNIYEDMSEDEKYMKDLYDNAIKLKIVGVVVPKSGVTSMALQNGVAYTSKLTDYLMRKAYETDIVKKQIENKDIDVFSNTDFDSKKSNSSLDFEDLIKVDTKMLESAFNIKIDQKDLEKKTTNYMTNISKSITADITPALNDFNNYLKESAKNIMNGYIEDPLHKETHPMFGEVPVIYESDVDTIVSNYFKGQEGTKTLAALEKKYVVPSTYFNTMYSNLISNILKGYIGVYASSDNTFNGGAMLNAMVVEPTITEAMKQAIYIGVSENMAQKMTEAVMQKEIMTSVSSLTTTLINSFSNAFDVKPEKIAQAFKFDLSEDELKRIMNAMANANNGGNAKLNLTKLGYQDKNEPTSISFYFKSFDSKEHFIDFIDSYNDLMEKSEEEEKVIRYTDTTGILMGSVKKVVNSVSYVLIAFVSISLVVSSIMIGIITYISVLERTKEIGILRAVGASKRNVSSIFSAETVIIGFLSGVMGIGITLLLIPIINSIIHNLTGNENISATIAISSCIILIVLSIILTLIGGLIPSKKASKQDPVIALRSE